MTTSDDSDRTLSATQQCTRERCTSDAVEGGRCDTHQIRHASPESYIEYRRKIRRLRELKAEIEEVSRILGNPDNSTLEPCIRQVEATINEVERPVSKRFRYGDYRDTAPVEAEYEH